MTRTGTGGKLTAIRIPAPLLARIDAFTKNLQAQMPGSEITRSEAIRILITHALDGLAPVKRDGTPPATGGTP